MKAIRRFNVRTVLPSPIAALGDLALNLHWSWHAPTRALFESIDPDRWEETNHDPVRLLARLSAHDLARLAADTGFVERVEAARESLQTYVESSRWYQTWSAEQSRAGAPQTPASIAYFSPEFGITHVLPQYSGGLGILAGDHLKSASDLGVPIVGVGLFYKTGYFVQSLSPQGWQQETYPLLDPDGLPLQLLREPDGSPCLVRLTLPAGRVLSAHIWLAQVGRVPLLLLDSDVPGNDDAARSVTEALYGGGGDRRFEQELLLGVGGVRALRVWSRLKGVPDPDVYHSNEGHAGFLGLERIGELVREHGLSFDEALEAVRASTVFTTHTPVPAGIDRFPADKVSLYFGAGQVVPGLPVDQVLELGSETFPAGQPGVFNMAVMGLRLAGWANGVSLLHGQVSREMFEGLWPGFDQGEVPIASITNGVHAQTWVDERVYQLIERHLGPTHLERDQMWDQVGDLRPADIWATKRQLRESLVLQARQRVRESWLQRGASAAELGWTDDVLDPDVLTIGFARRVPTYKRLTLMLRDPERLTRILLDPDRPVQLVIAGKSHPADETGKRLIQQMVQFADQPSVRHRIVFLPNYDIEMARSLYPGCDVWLNNPLRPFEACGTSGMKAALNGGLNLSILDGWWDEWYDGKNGWAIPTADGVADPDRRDDIEAGALYELIEEAVRVHFYDRNADGLPMHWISMLVHTLQALGPKVMATRMVRDYTTTLYAPAARAGWSMDGAAFPGARDLASFAKRVRSGWPTVRVEHVESSGVADAPQIGDTLTVNALVDLGRLSPADVEVQLVHGRISETDDTIRDVTVTAMTHDEDLGGRRGYRAEVTLTRTGAFGYTVRVVPTHPLLTSNAAMGLVVNAESAGAQLDSSPR